MTFRDGVMLAHPFKCGGRCHIESSRSQVCYPQPRGKCHREISCVGSGQQFLRVGSDTVFAALLRTSKSIRMTNIDEPPHRLSRILTETYATLPSRWRLQPPGNSNSRRTRQRLDSFRAFARVRRPLYILRTRVGPTVYAGEAFSPLISNTVHTFPIYAQYPAPYPETERPNVPCGIRVIGGAP
jgi:hypothetical protein